MEFKELKRSLHNAKKQATKVFCSEKNAEMHDNATKQKPHPNKQVWVSGFAKYVILNKLLLPAWLYWNVDFIFIVYVHDECMIQTLRSEKIGKPNHLLLKLYCILYLHTYGWSTCVHSPC